MVKIHKNSEIGQVNMTSARQQAKDLADKKPKENSKSEKKRPSHTPISRPSVKNNKQKEQKQEKLKKVKSTDKTSKKTVAHIPAAEKTNKNTPPNNRKFMLSRRHLIAGAAGIGAVAAGGIGIKIATENINKNNEEANTLNVDNANVFKSDNLTEYDFNDSFVLQNEISLPHGTLAWANNSNWIVALVPSGNPKPLCNVELININSGKRSVVLNGAVNMSSGYDIFDVRANNNGLIWVESNILSGDWKVYISSINSNLDTNPICVDAGNEEFEVPKIEVSNNNGYWLVMPDSSSNYAKNDSLLKALPLESTTTVDPEQYCINSKNKNSDKLRLNVIYSSKLRMQTPIYNCGDKIVIVPKSDNDSTKCQLTCIDESGTILDSICLPQNMKPLEAGYGENGFHFSFDAIYNYGGGIAGLGTYTPTSKINSVEQYNSCNWLNFSRVPTAPPCWCAGLFVIRSTSSICALDMSQSKYCVLDRPNASDEYGDYLVSSGIVNKVVTLAGISDINVSGDTTKESIMHIWRPI